MSASPHAAAPLFVFEDPLLENRAAAILKRLPPLFGKPVRIATAAGLRDLRGPVHAGAFLRERRIALDCTRAELARILVHEIFHFVWVRTGNPARRSFEQMLESEWQAGVRGELGWSAEWRKRELTPPYVWSRSRRWREYCCESFCDTAAWLYSGTARHPEFTLGMRASRVRRRWFLGIESRGFSI
jgi:hypothetical protein